MSRSPSRRRAALVGLTSFLLVAGAAACTTSDPAATTLDQGGYRQVPTSREAPSKQALDDINRELDAARTTVTSAPPVTERPSTTSTSAPTTDSTFAIDSSTSSEAPPPSSEPASPALTPADCKQFQQLVSFVDQVKDLIDPGNLDATAQRVGPPVEKSKAGFDQLLETKITEVAEPVRAVITWLRARGAGKEADDQAGLDATARVADFVQANCR